MEDNESISERLTPEDKGIKNIKWVQDEDRYRVPNDTHIILKLPAGEVKEEFLKGKEPGLKAKRFLELVQDGDKPGIAAQKINSSVKELMKDGKTKEALAKLIETNRLPNEVRKEMVRAGLNNIFLNNVDGGGKQQKLALAAASQIAKDPEVGLNLPPANIGVVIDMGKLGKLMDNMKPIPGLEKLLEVGGGESGKIVGSEEK